MVQGFKGSSSFWYYDSLGVKFSALLRKGLGSQKWTLDEAAPKPRPA